MTLTASTHDQLPGVPVRNNLQLLQRYTPESAPTTTPKESTTTGNGRLRIRCPRCRWQPQQNDRWSCVCGHAWNTFDTGGVCPECEKAWHQTQCLHCQRWSRHDDWYVWEESRRKI